jgi:small-conductance mechanosensitive channel
MPAATTIAGALRAATDPQVAACGPKGQQAWLCSTVYRISGSKDAADVADALAKPVRIVFVVAIAFVAVRLVRRVLRRVARHVREGDHAPTLGELGTVHEAGALERLRRAQRIETIAVVLGNVAAVVIWTIAVLVILGILGVELAPLLAGAGLVTVVIGFGAQTIVRDYLAGILMVLEDQFGVGDVIDVGDATGTVEAVSLRVTRLRDVEGVVWYVPNGEIKRLGNKSQQWSRALLDVAVAADTDIPRATEVIKQAADAMWHDADWRRSLLAEPEVWGVEDIGAAGIQIRLVVQTLPLEQWKVARELRARIKAALDDAEIQMPVPQQRITYDRAGGPPPVTDEEGS